MQVIAGAPNIVRGGSHSGNVSAALSWCGSGAVDGLASDYVPASLLEAAFACVAEAGHHPAAGRCDGDRGIRPRWPGYPIAAGSRQASAPTWCGCASMRACRSCRMVWRAGERVI